MAADVEPIYDTALKTLRTTVGRYLSRPVRCCCGSSRRQPPTATSSIHIALVPDGVICFSLETCCGKEIYLRVRVNPSAHELTFCASPISTLRQLMRARTTHYSDSWAEEPVCLLDSFVRRATPALAMIDLAHLHYSAHRKQPILSNLLTNKDWNHIYTGCFSFGRFRNSALAPNFLIAK